MSSKITLRKKTKRSQAYFAMIGYILSCFVLANTQEPLTKQNSPVKPNIIIIYADDMGIGDVSHMGGLAPTPHLDRMAKEGMRFADGHSSNAVCTPSRYSLLTGRHSWRTKKFSGVFQTPTAKSLIQEGEETLASFLKKHGYHSASIGKWHLGMSPEVLPDKALNPAAAGDPQKGFGWNIDYTKPVISPRNHGFDYHFGILSSLDFAPYVYYENEMALGIPTVTSQHRRLGAATADFRAEECLKIFAAKSVNYINERTSEAQQGKPFFLYLPLTSPHTPIVPSKEWQGKSPVGAYGDFLMETDWVVGEILSALEANNLLENTLVFFTADNGASPAAKLNELAEKGHHHAAQQLRGHKSDIFEGGHRVPFLALWPKEIPSGSVTERIVNQTDFMATFAEIIGVELDPTAGVDSESFASTLRDPKQIERQTLMVNQSLNGVLAIRQGPWKLVFANHGGGWKRPQITEHPMQLYNLDEDLGETTNLYEKYPEKVTELVNIMRGYVTNGRSTSGPAQPMIRDGERVWKSLPFGADGKISGQEK